MSQLLDTAIAANIIFDMIKAFNEQGIKVTIEDLEDLIKDAEAKKDAINKDLGIED